MYFYYEELDDDEVKKLNKNEITRVELIKRIREKVKEQMLVKVTDKDIRYILKYLDEVIAEVNWEYKRVKVGCYFLGPFFRNMKIARNLVTNKQEYTPGRYHICCEIDRMFTRNFNRHVREDFFRELGEYVDTINEDFKFDIDSLDLDDE